MASPLTMRTIIIIVSLLMALLPVARPDDGPYDYQRYFRALSCPIDPSSTAYVTITLPVVRSSNDRFPTVVLLNGFVLRSCVYAPYANALAAHGYAVVQFDDAKSPRSDFSVRHFAAPHTALTFPCLFSQEAYNDVVRLHWIDQVLACTKAAAVFADHFDWDALALVGHSRGQLAPKTIT